jgi:hypothetical protein
MTDKQQIAILRKALVDVVQKLGEMPGWKKVEDGLPESFARCLIRTGEPDICLAQMNKWRDMFWDEHDVGIPASCVTHWMPKPQPPDDSTPTLAETLQAICASALGDIEVGAPSTDVVNDHQTDGF